MLTLVKGDLFNSEAEVLVNPVNCKGVMGAGLAAQFKKRFPDNYKWYQKQCSQGMIAVGRPITYVNMLNPDYQGPKYIVNFPTKDHWRDPSKLEYITQGLEYLVPKLVGFDASSAAFPALGCGFGHLRWEDVKPIMLDALEPVSKTMDIAIVLW